MKGIWQGSGTWQASGGVAPVLVVTVVLLLLASGGAVAAAAAIITALVAVAAGVVLLCAVAVLAFALWRRRHPGARLVPQPQFHQLAEPGPKALPAAQPRQIVNNYYGGTHLHLPAATEPGRTPAVLPPRES